MAGVRVGRYDEAEEVRVPVRMRCTGCSREVRGTVRTGRAHSASDVFASEMAGIRAGYLCGRCRDKARVCGSDQ